MMRIVKIFVALCALSACYAVPVSKTRRRSWRHPPPKLQTDENAYVNDTIRLITEGDATINLDPNHTDIILVMGNTGAGKTTITKFITDVESLESYDAGDRLLVRDKHQKISENSTIVSKTIFPEMYIDPQTNTAFYDLPGFSDTRNSSVEIANAWFMKKVADHAQRVKLLFIVNHSSLRSGESRTDFKSFLEHSIDLVQDPLKFQSSIALVVSKVESEMEPPTVIQGIASFLLLTQQNLHEVMADQLKREAAKDLIEAFLSKDAVTGEYNRISFFQQPEDEGPLTSLNETMKQKAHIENVLYSNTIFTSKSPEDFGFTVSPAAKLLISKIAARLNQGITETMGSIGAKLASAFQSNIKSSPWIASRALLDESEDLEQLEKALRTIADRKNFTEIIIQLVTNLKLNNAADAELTDLGNRQKQLEFFEQISNSKFSPTILEWTNQIHGSVKAFKDSVSQKLTALSSEIGTEVSRISHQGFASLTEKLNGSASNNQEKLEMYDQLEQTMNLMNGKLSQAKSVSNFIQIVSTYIGSLDEQVNLTHLQELKVDIEFNRANQLNLLNWVNPFETLLTKIRDGRFQLKLLMLQDQSVEDKKKHNETILELLGQFEKEKEEQKNRLEKMKREHAEAVKGMETRMTEMKDSNQKEVERTRTILQQNALQIDQLMRKIAEQSTGQGGWLAFAYALGSLAG